MVVGKSYGQISAVLYDTRLFVHRQGDPAAAAVIQSVCLQHPGPQLVWSV